MTIAQDTVLARFRRAFPESERWFGPKQGFGNGDNGNRYMRLEYANRASIYFPLGVDHAHMVSRSVINFRPRAEALQQCLEENEVPRGCAKSNADSSSHQYVIGSQHANAIIAALTT